MLDLILKISLVFLTLSILATFYRLIKGPSSPDRIQALDSIGINLIAGVAITSVLLRTHAFFEVILLIGILSFIGTLAFARFLERGVAIESKRSE
ncbi:cation:proton antiporter [Bacillus sp. FJAT-18017]|uniref:Na(+)/H(+) antiporter subunit F1 n=1 Tax=unclassified Bacillus (in: firmicutes) TaxID=185979 RepID=UPI0005C44DA3|nr:MULTISPECIES: Na(+)/H(+) antiporter subunit F1 [unclassified Bacillus (in: firmicutes)]ALC90873.1 cation:proton antiporter [Bacillus sp. FJAT-18017]